MTVIQISCYGVILRADDVGGRERACAARGVGQPITGADHRAHVRLITAAVTVPTIDHLASPSTAPWAVRQRAVPPCHPRSTSVQSAPSTWSRSLHPAPGDHPALHVVTDNAQHPAHHSRQSSDSGHRRRRKWTSRTTRLGRPADSTSTSSSNCVRRTGCDRSLSVFRIAVQQNTVVVRRLDVGKASLQQWRVHPAATSTNRCQQWRRRRWCAGVRSTVIEFVSDCNVALSTGRSLAV